MWQVSIVVVLLLVNRWLWPVRQLDATFPVLPISEKSLQTIKNSADQSRQLDGVKREVSVIFQLSDCILDLCVLRFTDKTKIGGL